ncbi:MAG TPA: hypothetical protein VK789_33380 [Bryobacteraceae bacterium]|jgi:hypothetical protein|nr:hypothetical protein [Bryobacteraceae bacterium]
MPPVWEPSEERASIYGQIEKHSEGMISFAFEPPTEADLEALKKTPAYQKMVRALNLPNPARTEA